MLQPLMSGQPRKPGTSGQWRNQDKGFASRPDAERPNHPGIGNPETWKGQKQFLPGDFQRVMQAPPEPEIEDDMSQSQPFMFSHESYDPRIMLLPTRPFAGPVNRDDLSQKLPALPYRGPVNPDVRMEHLYASRGQEAEARPAGQPLTGPAPHGSQTPQSHQGGVPGPSSGPASPGVGGGLVAGAEAGKSLFDSLDGKSGSFNARKRAGEIFGVIDPKGVQMVPTGQGGYALRYGPGSAASGMPDDAQGRGAAPPFALFDPKARSLTLQSDAQGGLSAEARHLAESHVNIHSGGGGAYLLPLYGPGGQPRKTEAEVQAMHTAGQQALAALGADAASPEARGAALARAGLSPEDIRRQFQEGRISLEQSLQLNEQLNGITEVDTGLERTQQGLGTWAARPEQSGPMGAWFQDGTPEQKAVAVNRYFDDLTARSQGNILASPEGVEELRRQALGTIDPRWKAPGAASPGSAPKDGPAGFETIPLKEGGSTLIPSGKWTFEDIARIKDNPQLQAATPAVRQEMVGTLIGQMSDQITATTGYTKEAHLRLDQAAEQARQDVAGMTTLGDHLRYAGNVVVEAGKGEAGTAAALGADASITQPDGSARLPFGNTIEQSGYLAAKMKDTAQRMANPAAEKVIDTWLDTFCNDIKDGNFPFEPEAFGAWIKQQAQSLTPKQGTWYGATQGRADPATKEGRYQESYARNNSLDAPENLQLIQEYFKTHDPALLDEFRERIKKTPQRAKIDADQDASLNNNQIAKVLTDMTGRDAREDIKGLPGAVGSHLVPGGTLARLGKGSRGAKNVARAVRGVGSVGGNMVQTLIENPDADFEDHKKAAVDNLIASMGMRAAHGTRHTIESGVSYVFNPSGRTPGTPGWTPSAVGDIPETAIHSTGTAQPGQVDPSVAPFSSDVPAPGQAMPGNVTLGHQQQQPGTPRLQFSQVGKSNGNQSGGADSDVVQVHRRLAEPEDAFQLGKDKPDTSQMAVSDSLNTLAQSYSQPDLKLDVTPMTSGDRYFRIAIPNGEATITLDHGKKTVVINSANLDSNTTRAGGGKNVYQMVHAFAVQHGYTFLPDTTVSEVAQKRRISQMISSVLRHGTTDHLNGNATYKGAYTYEDVMANISPKTKVEIPGWKAGNHDHNLALLLRMEHDQVMQEARARGVDLSRLTHDPKTDTIIDGYKGTPIAGGALKSLVDRLQPGASGVGASTLLRAIVTGSALQRSAAGGGVPTVHADSGRDGGGQANGRGDGELVSVARDLYYSQAQGDTGGVPTRRMGDALSERPDGLATTVADTFRHLNQRQPGLINGNTQVFHSADDLINSDYAKKHPFSEEEKAAMRGAEGFFDASTGKTVIIAGNVGLRDGETPQSALTRVVLHERVGHDGLKLLLDAPDRSNGRPGINRARWEEIRGSIPGDELRAIGNEEGYKHLKDNPEGLALEWFARKAESSPELLRQDSVLRQMWLKFTEMVQDVRAHLGMDPLKGADLDTQVMALLSRARQAAVKGEGASSSVGVKGGGAAGINSGAPASPHAETPPSPATGGPGASAAPPAGTASLARPPLDVDGSRRLIANVMEMPERQRQHPTVQADLAKAIRVVAEARMA